MGKGRKPARPVMNPAIFEQVIDGCKFPLERDELRQLLIVVLEEAETRTHDGDGLLRKYRRRTPVEIVQAVAERSARGGGR